MDRKTARHVFLIQGNGNSESLNENRATALRGTGAGIGPMSLLTELCGFVLRYDKYFALLEIEPGLAARCGAQPEETWDGVGCAQAGGDGRQGWV
jgi:hypothetical protein